MRVVLTASIMDILHDGHINLLREMRKNGDKVIVVLHDDKSCWNIKGKVPIQPVWLRKRNIMITGLVDKVLITKSIDPADKFYKVIKKYKNILFMRADDNMNFPGRWLIDKHNIPIKFVPYTKGISSTYIKEKLCS